MPDWIQESNWIKFAVGEFFIQILIESGMNDRSRKLRAIIHGAAKFKKLLDHSIKFK